MLRAGSLFYALAISVLIALLSASLLLAAHFNRQNLQTDAGLEEVNRNAYSGMQLMLSKEKRIADENREIDLYGNAKDSVQLEEKSWGAFTIALVHAHRKNFSKDLVAAVGWKQDPGDHTALTLADLDRPVSISGATEIRGDCFLPKAGIQRSYIEGQSYSGSQLVYGNQKTANRFLPEYDDTLVKRIERLFSFVPGNNDSIMPLTEFETADSISNSFHNRPLYIFSTGSIHISNKIISGQVCIISRKSIEIENSSSIENAVLIAPEIVITEKTEGSFQAFASDSLVAEKDVHLYYPSVLGIIGSNRSPDRSLLLVCENASVMGQVFACSTTTDFRKIVLVRLEKESLVYGNIYSSGLVDLHGKVFGELTCSKFELTTNSAVYENQLLNAVIDRTKRSEEFTGTYITRKKTDHKAIATWLN